jgi:hypothetical protein
VRFLLRFFETNRLTPFGLYCLIAGTGLTVGFAFLTARRGYPAFRRSSGSNCQLGRMLHRFRSISLAGFGCIIAFYGCGETREKLATVPSAGSSEAAGALSAEARSAATGDIPDTQVFLVFANRRAGYSLRYPEGWTESGGGDNVTFKDKNNIVHVVLEPGVAPTPISLKRALDALKRSTPSLTYGAPRTITINGSQAVTSTYTTKSATDPVTGRGVLLIVDRYVLYRKGRVATIDLGTPRGVDNVDAYRMMIRSFRWR